MKKSMLLSTIAMIVVVVVALSTATFAWFSAQQQSTISGTATVAATKDFNIRQWTQTAWTSADSIPLTAENVAPVAPMQSLETVKLIDRGTTDVDAKYDENTTNKNWFKVDNAFGNFAAYTNSEVTTTNKIATIAPFQVAKTDKEKDTAAKVTITIKLGGDPTTFNSDDMTALKAINVVLHFQSYTKVDSNYIADQWVGTKYNTATTGLITNPNKDNAALGDASKKTAVLIESTGLVADGDIPAIASLPTVAGENYYKLTDEAHKGVYRQISAGVNFEANEYKLVTAYIWLDGYDARDNMMAKAFDISIGFTTTKVKA